MKGTLGDNETLYHTRLEQALFPGTTYGHVSGGDPPCITDLKWAELKAFHKQVIYTGVKYIDNNVIFGSIYIYIYLCIFLCNILDQNYHPSRCLFYTYGDMPPKLHLQYLNEKVLNQFNSLEKKDILNMKNYTIKSVKPWTEPRSVVSSFGFFILKLILEHTLLYIYKYLYYVN